MTNDPTELQSRPRAVVLGTFDGVHAGHRALMRRAISGAMASTVITFDPHPRRVLGRGVDQICSLKRRLELIEATGVEAVLVLEFTEALSRLTPAQWVRTVLRPIGTLRAVVGENYRFGYRRSGNADTLRALGIAVDAVPMRFGFSSTKIRELVRGGEIAEAARQLGRPLELEGALQPSASPNHFAVLVADDMLLPPDGTYIGEALDALVRVTVNADGPPREQIVIGFMQPPSRLRGNVRVAVHAGVDSAAGHLGSARVACHAPLAVSAPS